MIPLNNLKLTKHVGAKVTKSGTKITNVDFADDISMMANSADNMNNVIETFVRAIKWQTG